MNVAILELRTLRSSLARQSPDSAAGISAAFPVDIMTGLMGLLDCGSCLPLFEALDSDAAEERDSKHENADAVAWICKAAVFICHAVATSAAPVLPVLPNASLVDSATVPARFVAGLTRFVLAALCRTDPTVCRLDRHVIVTAKLAARIDVIRQCATLVSASVSVLDHLPSVLSAAECWTSVTTEAMNALSAALRADTMLLPSLQRASPRVMESPQCATPSLA
jgi:hypothetical protein